VKKRTQKQQVTILNNAGVNSLRQRIERSLTNYDSQEYVVTQDMINSVTEELTRWVNELLREK